MAKTKYKIAFMKGEKFYERSVYLETLELFFILCSECRIERREDQKKGKIVFIFRAEDLNTFISCKDLPIWILKKFLPVNEWIIFEIT